MGGGVRAALTIDIRKNPTGDAGVLKRGATKVKGAAIPAGPSARAAGALGQGLPPLTPPLRTPPPGLPKRWAPRPAREFVRPRYAGRFRCIASACEDTCCKDWGVPIDQATYAKYEASEALRPHLGTLIVLTTGQQTAKDYARIALNEQSMCPFLDAESLCGIHKQLGAEMLSSTCATYPLAVSTNAGQVEQALNLSCPEAARVTLFDPQLRRFPDAKTERDNSSALNASGGERYAAVRRDAAKLPRGYDSRLAIREFSLLLLGDRSYPLWQRVYLLGLLARRLDSLSGSVPAEEWSAANPDAVAKLLADSARVAVLGRLRPVMDKIEADPAQQLQLLVELLKLRFSKPPIPQRFIECVQDFELGIGSKTATSEEEILDAYALGYRQYFRPLMEAHPQVLENYLANYIFKNSYPFGRPTKTDLAADTVTGAESEHLSLCVHLALAQTLLIAMAGRYRESFGLDHVVKLVQSLARTIEHSKESLDQITVFVRQKNLNNPRGIALLLRQRD
jgi:lysine-N-methylase